VGGFRRSFVCKAGEFQVIKITGAGAILAVVLFSLHSHVSGKPALELVDAILSMTVPIYLSFRYSTLIVRFPGETGMDVL